MILITGANGLTGRYILPVLKEKYPDKKVRAIVRSREKGESLLPHIDDYVVGDLSIMDTAERAITEEVDSIIHIAGIRYSLNIMNVAQKYRDMLEQIIVIHTTGMYSKHQEYSGLYNEIEKTFILGMKESNLAYTILRPTMIYGSLRDKNMNKLVRYLSTKKIYPLFGQHGKMQPVFYQDLGKAVIASIENRQAYFKEYNISGGSVHTYGEIVRMVKKLTASKTLLIPVPYYIAITAAWLYEKIRKSPQITLEQVKRLSEDKVYDHNAARHDLGFTPVEFESGIKHEINEFLAAIN